MKNLIVRTITGIFFVAAIVICFMKPTAMVFLFALVTGLTIWEFTGLVNEHVPAVTVNRFITTVAGVYFFIAMAGYCSGITHSASVFIPYLLTLVYLFVSELYLKQENPINDWAYTMLSQMYIALPFSCINVLAFNNTGELTASFNTWLPLSVFIFLWVSDTGAYCCGSLLGKHKLFPASRQARAGKAASAAASSYLLPQPSSGISLVATRIPQSSRSIPRSPSGSASDLWSASSALGATWWNRSSSAPSASRTAATFCLVTAACSTASTRR